RPASAHGPGDQPSSAILVHQRSQSQYGRPPAYPASALSCDDRYYSVTTRSHAVANLKYQSPGLQYKIPPFLQDGECATQHAVERPEQVPSGVLAEKIEDHPQQRLSRYDCHRDRLTRGYHPGQVRHHVAPVINLCPPS